MPDNEVSDLLYGLDAIAGYLRMTTRQAKHRALSRQIPTFKVGRNVCARKASLTNWMTAQEAAALLATADKAQLS